MGTPGQPAGHQPTGHLPEAHLPEGGSALAAVADGCRLVVKRRPRRLIVDRRNRDMPQPSLTLSVGETITKYSFDFSEELEIQHEVDYEFSSGDFIRVDGFVYECTNAGKTAAQAPEWPHVIGQTVNDGSVEWTCRDFGSSGSDSISTRSFVVSAANVTVDSSAIVLSTRVEATITAVSVGAVTVTCTIVTAAGQTIKQALKVVVK